MEYAIEQVLILYLPFFVQKISLAVKNQLPANKTVLIPFNIVFY